MDEASGNKEVCKEPSGVTMMNIPLEGDIAPLEDVEHVESPIVTSTLVGKIINSKILNKGVVKGIIVKA